MATINESIGCEDPRHNVTVFTVREIPDSEELRFDVLAMYTYMDVVSLHSNLTKTAARELRDALSKFLGES